MGYCSTNIGHILSFQLVKGYESDVEIKEILDYLDWYIIPVANPDGYEFSRSNVSLTIDKILDIDGG